MWSLPSLPHHEDTTRCDHQRKQAELSRREQPHPTSRSRRTTATHHRGLFGSSLAMGVLSICTTENDPVKYNLNVGHVLLRFLYRRSEQIWRSKHDCPSFLCMMSHSLIRLVQSRTDKNEKSLTENAIVAYFCPTKASTMGNVLRCIWSFFLDQGLRSAVHSGWPNNWLPLPSQLPDTKHRLCVSRRMRSKRDTVRWQTASRHDWCETRCMNDTSVLPWNYQSNAILLSNFQSLSAQLHMPVIEKWHHSLYSFDYPLRDRLSHLRFEA